MLNILYAGCIGLSPAISPQLTLEVCAAAKTKCEKFVKNPFFDGSRSFKSMLIKLKKPMSSVCHNNQLVCTCLQPFSH